MFPEAVSEALGISLSEVLDLYFGELDEVQRGRLIGDTIDKRRLGEQDQEWLERESQRRDAMEVASYHEDNGRIHYKQKKRILCSSVVRKCKGHKLSW
jgi:hypothetical protein